MNGFRIRDARRPDCEAIGVLWAELMAHHRKLDGRFAVPSDGQQRYVRHLQEMIRSRDARVLVAEEVATGALVGYLMGELQTRPVTALPGLYGFISDACVTEGWRHHGVGRALFTEIRRWFVDRKARAVELYAAEHNPAALAFWEAMGLEPFLKLMHLEL